MSAHDGIPAEYDGPRLHSLLYGTGTGTWTSADGLAVVTYHRDADMWTWNVRGSTGFSDQVEHVLAALWAPRPARVLRPVTITTPGEVLLDLDGVPTAVGPSRSVSGLLYGWPDPKEEGK